MPKIKVFTAESDGLNPSSFVALAVPVNCNGYLLKNLGPDRLYMRSDISDGRTEDFIESGGNESLTMPPSLPGSDQSRYRAGYVLYYVKCTGPVVGKFWM